MWRTQGVQTESANKKAGNVCRLRTTEEVRILSAERLLDDLAHVARLHMRGDLFERGAHLLAQRGREAAPQLERAGEARGDLRIERIERDHLLGPERVAGAVFRVELRGIRAAETEDQRACAIRVLQVERGMRHEPPH